MTNMDKLYEAVEARGPVCVGLDTDFSYLPADFVDSTLTRGENIVRFNQKLIDATKAVAGCYKVQIAYYESLGLEGMKAYADTLKAVPEAGAPVIAYTALAMLFMGLTEYANKAYELEQATVHVLQNSAIAACIKVVSSIVLLKALGFTGGALGSIVAFASYFFITCVRVRSRFLFRVPTLSVVRIIVSAALCGAAAYGCTLLPLGNLLRLALACVVGAAVYAVCIIASGEGREEVQAVLRRIRK